MISDTSSYNYRDKSYLIVNNGSVVDIGNAFAELTGYSKADIIQQNISEVVNELLRINPTIQEIENNETNTPFFLFTKSFDAIEVAISVSSLDKKKLYIFTEDSTSRLTDKLTFVELLSKDNVMGCAIFSVPDLILLKTNQRFLDFMDSPFNRRENSLGISFKEILIGFKGTQAEVTWNTVLETQETSYLKEFRHDKFARGITYWDGTLTPIFEKGKMKYIVEIATEVTERVRDRQHREEQARIIQSQKEQLEQQNAQLDAIIENMSDALLIFDKDGNYTRLNKTAREIYAPLCGHSKKVGDGRKQAVYFDSNGCLIPHEEVLERRVRRGEKVENFQMKIQYGEKSIYTEANGTPVYNNRGDFIAGVLCCRDITKKILMENSLKESEAKFKDLFNNMQLGQAHYQIISDAFGSPIDYLITEVNPAYERIINMNRNDVIGKKATEIFPGIEYRTDLWESFREVALTGKSVSREVYSNITKRWYEDYCYRPKLGCVTTVFSDITNRKNNEEELRNVKERLQEAQKFACLGYWEMDVINGEHS